MEEVLKLIAAGGGIGVSATWAYWLWKIEPRFQALERTVLEGQKIDLLRMAEHLSQSPELHAAATRMLEGVEAKIADIKQ